MSISDPKEGAAGRHGVSQPGGTDDPDEEVLRPGHLIDGRYRVIEFLGRGGMGTVYKAEHVTIRRVVAIKLLHPSLARIPEVSRRFEREAFAIGRIAHPNCVNVSDFGRLDDGSLFLVMEYLEGRSLGDELAEKGRIEPLRALRILRHVLAGLGHAHDNGIVHRDVKPENVVLIEHEGNPDFAKILDFGIAKLMGTAAQDDGGGRLTQAGVAFGTPIYMSPEQAVGNPIDGRADLYAATVMTYEMIAGQPPFQSEDKIEVMSMHTSRPVPPLAEVAPEVYVDTAIEELLLHGLTKRPDGRFPDARTYIAAIDGVLAELEAPKEIELDFMPSMPTPMDGMPLAESSRASQLSLSGVASNPSEPVLLLPIEEPRPERPSRRIVVILSAIAVLGLCILAVAVLIGRSSQEPGSSVPLLAADAAVAHDAALPPPSLAEQAKRKLAEGNPQEAIALLLADESAIAGDAAAQLQLGNAHASMAQYRRALTAYRNALDLAPSLDSDQQMRAHLGVMLKDRESDVVVEAAALMFDKLDDDSAGLLIELASGAKRAEIRHRAIQAAEERNAGDRIDRAASLMLDLEQGKNCKARREVVAKLRALGDKRAIPALQEERGHRRKNRRNWVRNKCLRQDATEAIQYLESLELDAGTQ